MSSMNRLTPNHIYPKKKKQKQYACSKKLSSLDLTVYRHLKFWKKLNIRNGTGTVKDTNATHPKVYTFQTLKTMVSYLKHKTPSANKDNVHRALKKLELLGYIESGFFAPKRHYSAAQIRRCKLKRPSKAPGDLDKFQNRTKSYTTTGKYEKTLRRMKSAKCIIEGNKNPYKTHKMSPSKLLFPTRNLKESLRSTYTSNKTNRTNGTDQVSSQKSSLSKPNRGTGRTGPPRVPLVKTKFTSAAEVKAIEDSVLRGDAVKKEELRHWFFYRLARIPLAERRSLWDEYVLTNARLIGSGKLAIKNPVAWANFKYYDVKPANETLEKQNLYVSEQLRLHEKRKKQPSMLAEERPLKKISSESDLDALNSFLRSMGGQELCIQDVLPEINHDKVLASQGYVCEDRFAHLF